MRVFDRWRSWDDAAAGLTGRLPDRDVAYLGEVFRFADGCHGGQTRPAGEPYTTHLLEVVEILATALGTRDVDLLAAGLLHDVVEDTGCTLPEVGERFGDRTAELVNWVTMPPAGPGQNGADGRHAYLARLRTAPPDAVRLKLADRYSNVQRLHTHPRVAKQRSYYAETCQHFVPAAAADPTLASLYADWQEAYNYLAGPVGGRRTP